jgi:pilus assembly protein Flp/PilA
MSRSHALAARFLRDQRGATMIEYGLVATLVSITIIALLVQMGTSVSGFFQTMAEGLRG